MKRIQFWIFQLVILRYFIPTILSLLLSFSVRGTELVDVTPLTDRILMLHFNEGHVIHHQRCQSRSDEKVIISPLDTEAASRPITYPIRSPDDEHYSKAQTPLQVGRKSKGTDFAWFVDKWENGHAANTRPGHTKGHWIYLFIPEPLRRGKTYLVGTESLASSGSEWKLVFDESKSRSEAIHVNLLGYVLSAPFSNRPLRHVDVRSV